MTKIIYWILGIIVGSFILGGSGIIALDFGFSTTQGQHTGVITVVEKSGVFFKTYDVYIKTSAMSTQEDTYCAIDPNIIQELQNAQTSQEQITISYYIPHWIELRQCSSWG